MGHGHAPSLSHLDTMKISDRLRELLAEMKDSDAKLQRLIDDHCTETRRLLHTQEQLIRGQN
jgi:hypothetical protein